MADETGQREATIEAIAEPDVVELPAKVVSSKSPGGVNEIQKKAYERAQAEFAALADAKPRTQYKPFKW